ncbi:MAG: SusC/RagA family TonB-linked outer membrane protein [Marinilabiliaceae bacterium]|nr:SusC/RagA family TonB-linked outer membrane protein [Marinilabiliaceae bacterium]
MKYILKLVLFTGLLVCVLANIQAQANGEIVIQGIITGKADGEPLLGVNVIEMNVDNRNVSGSVTDFNGQYVLKIKDAAANKIVFSFIGYESQTIKVTKSGVYNIVLVEETQELDAVTVKAEVLHNDGTFTIAQREIAQATQRISAEEFEGLQVTSIDEALQGRISGLDIVSTSGDPGSGTTMRIRGATSINAGAIPLIVINNVPYSSPIDENFDFANSNQEQYANLLSINPDDIDDITVLKDAAASAIWGSRGANGVIMIKTKRGTRGPTRFQYSYRLTNTWIPEGYKLLNGDDFTMLMKQAYFNVAQSEDAANRNEYNYYSTFNEYENYNNNTDWVDEVTQTGIIHDHILSASGGGERAHYRISAGYLDQRGTIIGQELQRISTRSNLEYTISDRLRVISELAFTYTDNHRNVAAYDPYFGYNDQKRIGLLAVAMRKMPNMSVYRQDRDGNNTSDYYNVPLDNQLGLHQYMLANPVALANLGTNRLSSYRIIPTFKVMYDIIRPERHRLQYNAYISFDLDNSNVKEFVPREAQREYYLSSYTNRASSSDNENLTFQTDNNITFTPKFNNEDHTLTLYASFQANSGRSTNQFESTYAGAESAIDEPSASGYNGVLKTWRGQWRSVGLMARGHYVYKGRYIFSGTIRRDGSTKFGIDNRYGYFPGVSLKWIISDEPFMKVTNHWLSMLAIRPSWGVSGNQPKDEYLHYSTYATVGDYINTGAILPSSVRLNDLRWEKSSSLNMGADIGFFNDKLVFDVNYYYQRTEDLLFKDQKIPSTTGFSGLAYINAGTMDNEGWEFNIYGNKVIKVNDFSVDFNFNIANNRNTLIFLEERVMSGYNKDFDYKNGTYGSLIQENNPFGSIYGFRYKGVYQYSDYMEGLQEDAPVARDVNGNVIIDSDGEPLPMMYAYGLSQEYEFKGGDAKYEDINHDGSIDELDIVYLGNSNPKFYGGFGTTLRYKNLYCNMFFNYRYGNKIVNVARMNLENMYTDNNQSIAVNYRWRKDGDVTEIPRALYGVGYNWLGSDRYVEDGSFLRFKYLKFSYSVSKNQLKKLNLEKVDFHITFNNLFVWSHYSGVDPEVGYGSLGVSTDGAQTPRSKDFMLGLTIGF